jgi:tetraacyldisaccharide 4'-kinase
MTSEAIWYRRFHPVSLSLLPLSWLYGLVVRLRRLAYGRGWLAVERLPVPVIVVGNLTVGGTGKTPAVLWLTQLLRREGLRPGIVLRGYGGSARDWPRQVTPASDPYAVGDEAVLLARNSGCPVAAGPDRVAAARSLLAESGCDIIVSDDGLQHYRLARDLEVLVVDGERGFGNRRCLPAGPLREPVSRARGLDLVLCNGGGCPAGEPMALVPGPLTALADPARTRPLAELRHLRVTAVAGIGNPARFFATLRRAGLKVDERPYPDHHRFTREEAAAWPPGPVLMTEKDAVKCERFAGRDHWYLPVRARIDAAFGRRLLEQLRAVTVAGEPAARLRAALNEAE